MKSLKLLLALADANPDRQIVGVDRELIDQAHRDLERLALVLPAALTALDEHQGRIGAGGTIPASQALREIVCEVLP